MRAAPLRVIIRHSNSSMVTLLPFMIPPGRLVGMPHVDKRLRALEKAREEAQAALRMSKDRMRSDLTSQPKKPYKFSVGDMVWLQSKNVKVHQQSQKLGPKQLGPFAVTEVLSDLDYRLQLPPALKLHDVFHIDRLSPWKGNDINGQEPPPPGPLLVEGEEEYEVGHIRDIRKMGRTLKALVRWKGYGEGDDTWEPLKNLDHASEALADFYRRHPGAPRKINAVHFASMPWQSIFNVTE